MFSASFYAQADDAAVDIVRDVGQAAFIFQGGFFVPAAQAQGVDRNSAHGQQQCGNNEERSLILMEKVGQVQWGRHGGNVVRDDLVFLFSSRPIRLLLRMESSSVGAAALTARRASSKAWLWGSEMMFAWRGLASR